MRTYLLTALACLCSSAGFAQQPAAPPVTTTAPEAAPPAGGGLQPKAPLTPAEQREKDIRMFDPLDKSSPVQGAPDSPGVQDSGTQQQTTPTAPRQTTPLPGSVAGSNGLVPANPRNQGPQVVSGEADAPTVLDFGGPAVLSRSYTLARPMVPRQVRWSPTLGVSLAYDTGLTSGEVNPDGSLAGVSSFGTILSWGLTGRHFWKHDQFGLEYSGNYNRYTSQSSYNGMNHFLNADYGHEFSRRLSFNATISTSQTSYGNALINQSATPGLSVANIDLAVSPSTQILDQGTRQFSTMLDLTWRQSARLSFDLGGGFFAIDRTGAPSTGNIGYQSRADMNYRYTRRMTVGAYYSFTDYAFAHQIELSNAHTVGGIFSYAINRVTQFRFRGGITRVENKGLTDVPIDPLIAALIGRNVAIVDAYSVNAFSDISAQLARDFGHNRTANISYAHGLAPGNGVVMTSVQQTASAAYSMLLLRKITASASVDHSSLTSVSQTIGNYVSSSVGVSFGRALSHGMLANLAFSYRRFNLANEPTVTSQFRVSTGVTWGPGENRLW